MHLTQRRNLLLLWVIIIAGCLLRIVFIHNRDLFVDEVYYWRVSNMNSWKNLIFIKHWIKDHGILYYLFLKPLIRYIPDIPTLRYTNLLFYVAGSLSIYLLLRRKSIFLALFGVALFSFHRYFVYLSSTLSPYNLVCALTLISITSIFLIFQADTHNRKGKCILFILSTSLAFYSDYSFFFTLPFYLGFLLFFISNTHVKGKEKSLLIYMYLSVVVLILPGIFQFYSNLSPINNLFARRYFEPSFIHFFYIISGITFSRLSPITGVISITLTMLLLFLSRKRESIFIAIVYLTTIGFLFIIQRYFFSLFAERYLWSLYFVFILVVIKVLESKKYTGFALIVLFVICSCINYIIPSTNTFHAPGDSSYEVKYSSLIYNPINSEFEKIVILDRTSASDVLSRYYFSPTYPPIDKDHKIIESLRKKIVILSSKDTPNIPLEVAQLTRMKDMHCILYYISNDINTIISDTEVKQLGCKKIYFMDNLHDYIDTFTLLNAK